VIAARKKQHILKQKLERLVMKKYLCSMGLGKWKITFSVNIHSSSSLTSLHSVRKGQKKRGKRLVNL